MLREERELKRRLETLRAAEASATKHCLDLPMAKRRMRRLERLLPGG